MLRPLRRILGRADGASGPVEEAFRALAEVVFEGIAVVEGGRISKANKAFASIFGYQQSAVVGRALPDLVEPEAC